MPNVIVTGGTRGIGLRIARRLAADGYVVIAVARNSTDDFVVAQHCVSREGAGELHVRKADLSDIAGLPTLVRDLRKEFGSIHGLVNNAGIGPSGMLANMRDTQISALIQLNTLSPIILTKYVVRGMIADGDGRIVNIASVVGFQGYSGLAAYSATKAAVIGFTKSLAREVGPQGITVNAVAPGFIDTELTENLSEPHRQQIIRRSALRRLANVDDIAEVAAFLLGIGGRNITGTVLTVDAGSTA